MISWPEELVLDIAARRSVIFLGAGVSKNAVNKDGEHPLDWNEYLSYLADGIHSASERAEIVSCIEEGDLLTACELAQRYLGPPDFKGKLLRMYLDKAFSPSQIHEDIGSIDSRFVLTTSFDKVYENSANNIQQSTVLVKNYYDDDVADVFRRSQRVVLKVHGTIDSVDKTIFTRLQYARARHRYATFYNLLRGLFVTHTFVFLGASLRDPDMQLILEDHAHRFEGSRPHFIVMPRDPTRSERMRVLADTMNLKSLEYDPVNNHAELALSIRDLVGLVERAREEMARSVSW